MIKNERQYKITRTRLNELESALAQREAMVLPEDVEEGMWALEQEALRAQIDDLRVDLKAYERLSAGEVRSASLASLDDLGLLLVQARIAQGLTQKELAERLGVKEQQVQKDEANLYESASLHRLQRLTRVLAVEFDGEARLPVRL